MARPKEFLDEELVELAKAELKKIKEHKICFRLQAIISSSTHSLGQVSSILNVNRTTIWRWIKRFNNQGITGLRDRPRGHRLSKLGKNEQEQITRWLEESKDSKGEEIYWTLPLLIQEINSVYGIQIGKTALWNLVRKLGFRQKVPRPYHAKSDPKAQEAFKKNF